MCSALTKAKLLKDAVPLPKKPDLEQGIAQYEEAPRQRLADEKQQSMKQAANRLPTKTPDGQLVYNDSHAQAALPKVTHNLSGNIPQCTMLY